MKAYLFDLINKAQRKSQSLDIKALLCNKTWRVFSDTDDKEIRIFMEDGSLVISINGTVEMGKWMYVPANCSLVITGNGQNLLVNPVLCNNVLVLVQDGTNMCSFLLDETNTELERMKTLAGLKSYLEQNLDNNPNSIKSSIPQGDNPEKSVRETPASSIGMSSYYRSMPIPPKKSAKELEQEISFPRHYASDDYIDIQGFCKQPLVTDDSLRVKLGRTIFESTFYYEGFPLTGLIHDKFKQHWFIHVQLGKVRYVYTKYDDETNSLAKKYFINNDTGFPTAYSQYEPNDTYWSSFKYLFKQGRISYIDYPIANVESELKKVQIMKNYGIKR